MLPKNISGDLKKEGFNHLQALPDKQQKKHTFCNFEQKYHEVNYQYYKYILYTVKYFTLQLLKALRPAPGGYLELRALLLPGAGGCGRGTRRGAGAATRGWPGCSPSPPGARWSSAAAPRGGRWPGTPCTCSPSRPSPLDSSAPPGCGIGKTVKIVPTQTVNFFEAFLNK